MTPRNRSKDMCKERHQAYGASELCCAEYFLRSHVFTVCQISEMRKIGTSLSGTAQMSLWNILIQTEFRDKFLDAVQRSERIAGDRRMLCEQDIQQKLARNQPTIHGSPFEAKECRKVSQGSFDELFGVFYSGLVAMCIYIYIYLFIYIYRERERELS